MINPYPNLPRDKGNEAMQNYATHASVKAVYASENASASSVITLTEDTTVLEIAVVSGTSSLISGGVMRWVTSVAGSNASTSVISAAGTANFDHVIANNTIVKFAVPIERQETNAFASVQGANRANGLYRRVAIKSIGVASILLTEY